MNHRKAILAAFIGYLAFVIYGSLVPFELRDLSFEQALQNFANIRYLDLGIGSRADWVANIVLYIPLSFLGCMVVMGMRKASHFLLFLMLFFGLSVALSIEFTQLFFAPRTVSLNDLIAEALGTLGGIGLWLFGRRQLCRLWDSFHKGGQQSILAVLYGYFAVYFLQSLFPFDFIVSFDELSWKLDGDGYGLLFAGDCSGALRCFARLIGEGVAFAPLGFLISLAFSNISLKRTFVAGLVVGFVIEFLQFFVASGVSQGLSVLIRGIGLAAGLQVGAYLTKVGPERVAKVVSQAVPFLFIPYLIAIATLAGWFSGRWSFEQDFSGLLNDVKLMPFYYHYYTTESAAMANLLANTVMYAPLGLAVWAWHAARGRALRRSVMVPAIWGGSLATIIELGKLLVPEKHPDMTNLLISSVSVLLVCQFATWIETILNRGGEVFVSSSSRKGRKHNQIKEHSNSGGVNNRSETSNSEKS